MKHILPLMHIPKFSHHYKHVHKAPKAMYAPARKPKISSFCQLIAHLVHPEDIAAFAISAGTLNVISYPPQTY